MAYLHSGLQIIFEDEATGETVDFAHAGGIAEFLAKLVAERGKPPCTEQRRSTIARENERRASRSPCSGPRRTDEHIRSYVNGIRPAPAARTRPGFKAGIVKAVRNYIETHELTPKGVTLTAEDIREGIVGILSVFVREPQFQGQTKERLNNPEVAGAGRRRRPPGAREVAQRQQDDRRGDRRRASSWRRARARRRARRRRRSRARRRSRHRLNLPGKLADCSSTDPGRVGAVHRRGRLRRRLGQAGPRPPHAGDPAAARQGPQRRAGVDRRRCSTTRSCRTSSPRSAAASATTSTIEQAALRQDLPADGRRQRRPPHLDAAADVLLPPHAQADRERATSTSRSRRCTASTSARRRYWALDDARPRSASCARRRRTPSPRSAASRASARCRPRTSRRRRSTRSSRSALRVDRRRISSRPTAS